MDFSKRDIIPRIKSDIEEVTDKQDKSITIKIEPWYHEEEKDYKIGCISPNNEVFDIKSEPGLHNYRDIELSANAKIKKEKVFKEIKQIRKDITKLKSR